MRSTFTDRTETRFTDGMDGYLVDIQAWHGGDIDKLWMKGEYEGDWGGKLGYAETQALWSHAIGPWFDLQAGARFDAQTGPNRGHIVLGVEGLAPYWFEVEAAAFLSNKGDLTARAEGEYDLRITQKLILQPRAEVNLSGSFTPEQVAACVVRVTVHELGHAIGILRHSSNPADLMYPSPAVAAPSDGDRRTVEVLYHTAPTIRPRP